MRVLITGAAGFVGRHLTLRLLQAHHEVVAVDSLAPRTGAIAPGPDWAVGNPLDFSGFRFIQADCRDWFAEHPQESFDQVHHLAALVGGREVIENDPLAVALDLAIDATFWRWTQSARPGWAGCYSSSAAYPVRLQTSGNYRLLSEDDIDFTRDIGVPDLTYGWAKLTAEYLARIAYEKHGIGSCIFRPFSGYGEDQDLAYPFPSIVRRVLKHRAEPVLKVWGSGKQMRDFVHIEDCVDLILLAAEHIHDATAINISTGVLMPFDELIRAVGREVGASFEVQGMSDRPEGVFARGGDTARQRRLGFTPRIGLAQGIARAVAHFSRV